MKIGLPKALLYYNYKHLWKEFFSELGADTVISGDTNAKTLKDGRDLSIDECCLSFKIFMGHIAELKDKCDYVLVPRIDNFSQSQKVCVKFNALYDIVKNTVDAPLIDYNIDEIRGQSEKEGFVKMGRFLGFKKSKCLKAYNRAKEMQDFNEQIDSKQQENLLNSDGLKILLVGHPYNCYDAFIGKPIADFIKQRNVKVIYADRFYSVPCLKESDKLSSTLQWVYNKHLVGAVNLYKDRVDGIIFITSFPCGPDSLINELVLRKLSVPTCNIIVDELQGENGLQTRLESFIDIIAQRKIRLTQDLTYCE